MTIRRAAWAAALYVACAAAAATTAGQSAQPAERFLTTEGDAERVVRAWNDSLPYVPGELLVRFADRAAADGRARAMRALRGQVAEAGTTAGVVRFRTPDEPDAEQAAAIMRRQPEVAWAQPNYVRPLLTVPNDPGYERQWHLRAINMPRAWDISDGGAERIVVAVIDSGVTTFTDSEELKLWTGAAFETVQVPFAANPDLSSSRTMSGKDFVFWTGPVVDMVGHGTHVAGTILQATNNGLGSAGIAHRATLLPLKACYGYWEIQFTLAYRGQPGFVRPSDTGGCPDSAVAEALHYAADAGAHVINLSLGGSEPSPILLEALQYAVQKGAFIALAGGNEFTDGNPVTYPARYAAELDGVVSVAAATATGVRARYSNTGSYIELAAPGGDTREGGSAAAVYQVSLIDGDFDPRRTMQPRFDRYAEVGYQGTSMAAPHVAGVAALLAAQGVTRPAAIEAALRRFARDLGAPGRDDEFGDGLIDAAAALRGRGVGVAR